MVVHPPQIAQQDGHIRVSSRIGIENCSGLYPDTLWFSFPETYREYVTDRSEACAAALLPLAMDRAEKLQVRGTVSPRLANRANRFSGSGGGKFEIPRTVAYRMVHRVHSASTRRKYGAAFDRIEPELPGAMIKALRSELLK